ncbi:sensor histidine kinase [Melioribacter sp. OK-6-Me]|uniref:sensor histidine kinase n=1 Tax=unclassified Melioribacter TaxID=2627329 RepID=UPI003ED9D8DF
MKALIPEWAKNYGEFWRAIRIRNLWFIRLRYFAVISLLLFLIAGEFLLNFQFSNLQKIAISIIIISILSYNIILYKLRAYIKCDVSSFNSLHLSLIQMILDLIALMILVYYTGIIESPLYLFFIFHMIIGSLILPAYVVYIMACIICLTLSFLTIMQNLGIIETHLISGLYDVRIPHTMAYDILSLITFTAMIFISVYLANNIVRQLYKREQQLRDTLQRLDEAEKAKQKYTIGIIHEVKTPVTAIKSIIDLILNNFLGDINSEIRDKLKRAQLRTDETLQLLNNILRLSRLKLLDIRSSEEIDIYELIIGQINKMEETIKAKSIDLSVKDIRESKKIIKSDITLLELAFSNLIANSIKYVNEGGIIEILLRENDYKLFIEICDNGIGIPKEDLPNIFQQFYRASNVIRSKHEGSGLGLALVKEIIERLGGTITAESPSRLAGKTPGSCFIISLEYNFQSKSYDIFQISPDNYLNDKSRFEEYLE